MTEERRKRLIEVAFPLEEVSAHSRREKNVRHGHISTLHIWWARRPLAACRAFIYASLVDDPGNDAEREELLREVADLACWDAVRHPDRVIRAQDDGGSGLTGIQLLERARQRILDCNNGQSPKLLDPFAGGGAIPLEALRLGCETTASDLNPVAVLVLKGTIEYPQMYGQPDSRPVPDYIRSNAGDRQARFTDGDMVDAYQRNPLATDVTYWGRWVLERAGQELAEFYPRAADGTVTVAYLWSRTIPCPNCAGKMPLIRQYWLARKDKKKVALEPLVDSANGRVDFKVVVGSNINGDPAEATTSHGDAKCLICGQVVEVKRIRAAGVEGKIGAMLTTVITAGSGRSGKEYRADEPQDLRSFVLAETRVGEIEAHESGELSTFPDEPVPYDPQNLKVRTYGMNTWRELFNARQLLALTTFARLVGEAHTEMLQAGLDADYAKAVATYLGLTVDRLADYNSTITRWASHGEYVGNTFTRQALPMVWDYCEINPMSGQTGSFQSALEWVALTLDMPEKLPSTVTQLDSRMLPADGADIVITDPPYFDSINYSNLSDFFYVWLKRSIGFLYPDLLELPLTPKRDEIIMNVYGSDGDDIGKNRKQVARKRYVDGMAQSFQAISRSLEPGGLVGVVFAHTDPEAWATLIEGLLASRLVPEASWPIDTELENKASRLGQARLMTSVWMACRRLEQQGSEAFIGDVLGEMRPVVRERLLYFWSKGIRGADFFISAIGPALSVFGRHSKVLRPDGSEVSVRDFLDVVRRESTDVALEQVLSGADLGLVDTLTRQYVTWVWSYSRAPLDAGEAIALCLATGTPYQDVVRPQSIAVEAKEKSKKMVKLRTIRERALGDDDFGTGTAARPATLIEQLQHAAWQWGQNRMDRLGAYRGTLGESRWAALHTLGQAVAGCLPDGDEDRRMILGLLGSNVVGAAPTEANGGNRQSRPAPAGAPLPGFEDAEEENG